jgi:hypothetical protein
VAERSGEAPAKPGAPRSDAGRQARRAPLEDLYHREFGVKPDPEAASGQRGARKPREKPADDKAADAWMEDKLCARVAVTDARLQQLGRQRGQAVMALLVA